MNSSPVSSTPPILLLGQWTRRLAETHIALGRAKEAQINAWADAYLGSSEPNVTGAINTANANTASARALVACLEHEVSSHEAVVDFLRRVTSWDSLPEEEFHPFPRNE